MGIKQFIILAIASLLLTISISCLPSSTPLSQSQVLSQSSNSKEQLLRLIGIQEPQIQVVKGAQWGTQSLQHIFKGGNWIFYPDGKFTFTPSLNANIRSDLYPISGTYKQTNNI